MHFAVACGPQIFEEQVDGPKTCQRYHHKDDAADNGIHSAEDPAHQIKLEQAHQSPVQATDDSKDQSNFIHCANFISFVDFKILIVSAQNAKNMQKNLSRVYIFSHIYVTIIRNTEKFERKRPWEKTDAPKEKSKKTAF